MIVVTGATGNVGSSVVARLLELGREIAAITHDAQNVPVLEKKGARAVCVDIRDTEQLRRVLDEASAAFLLNPPGDVSQSSVEAESETVRSLVDAVQRSRLKRVVVQSTLGAQPGRAMGDLGVLFDLEEGIRRTGVPASITRAAFYMSNWAFQLENAKAGRIQSMFPEDFELPMVAPQDVGRFNAERLVQPDARPFAIDDVVGPADYAARDVARAFAAFLDRRVQVEVVPPERWTEALRAQGYAEESAASYAAMMRIVLEKRYALSDAPVRGTTSLHDYIAAISK